MPKIHNEHSFVSREIYEKVSNVSRLVTAIKASGPTAGTIAHGYLEGTKDLYQDMHKLLHETNDELSCDDCQQIVFLVQLSHVYAGIAASGSQSHVLRKLDLLRACVSDLKTMYEEALLSIGPRAS